MEALERLTTSLLSQHSTDTKERGDQGWLVGGQDRRGDGFTRLGGLEIEMGGGVFEKGLTEQPPHIHSKDKEKSA